MRSCKGKYWSSEYRNYKEFENGVFHQWGNNYEEFLDGVGNYSVAIVELPNGKVIMPCANDIQFTDIGGNE